MRTQKTRKRRDTRTHSREREHHDSRIPRHQDNGIPRSLDLTSGHLSRPGYETLVFDTWRYSKIYIPIHLGLVDMGTLEEHNLDTWTNKSTWIFVAQEFR